MITVEGRHGVKATLIRHSIALSSGIELPTWEVEYPRIVLAEANTHGQLAKNSASSRAIPFEKMKAQLRGRPVEFGANQSGMMAKNSDHNEPVIINGVAMTPDEAWWYARDRNVEIAEAFAKAGYHKQIFNRFTEAYQMMKTVISGTETPNFFWLRNHSSADPTIHELAHCMREGLRQSKPDPLNDGEWHLPYVEYYRDLLGYEKDGDTPIYGPQQFYIGEFWKDFQPLSLEEAIKVSGARTAAVSYRNEDYGVEASNRVYGRLVGEDRIHGSALEHQATPIVKSVTPSIIQRVMSLGKSKGVNNSWDSTTWQQGVSHATANGHLWSGRFRGWVQHRKLIPNENYTGEF